MKKTLDWYGVSLVSVLSNHAVLRAKIICNLKKIKDCFKLFNYKNK